jgi:hypothetical protein
MRKDWPVNRRDLHARQQTLAMLDTETGEMVNLTLMRSKAHR